MSDSIIILGHHLVLKSYQELIQSLAHRLIKKKLNVILITPEIYLEKTVIKAEEYPQRTFKHIKLKTVFGKTGRQHAHFYIGLNSVIQKYKPSLIFCMEEPNSLVSAQLCYLSKKNNSKILLWSALNQYRDYSKYKIIDIRRYIFHWATTYCFENSDGIVAIDNSVKKVLEKKNYRKNISVCNTFGVNKEFFKKPRLNNSKKIRLIYVGLLEKYKGVEYLVNSVNSRMQLDIVGDGCEMQYLESLSAGKNINFHGFKEHKYIIELMERCDVLILPSIPVDGYLEQFGRVLIEAMANGLCVIGSDIGGIPKVIGDAGFVVKHSNSEDLNEVLVSLSLDSEKLNISKIACYKRAKDIFSYNSVSKDIEKILFNESQ